MRSQASFRSHPIYPMLIVFPIALWMLSLVGDIAYRAGAYNAFWKGLSFYSMLGGIIGAFVASVPVIADYLLIDDRQVQQVATIHMILNLIVVLLFIFNLGMRFSVAPDPDEHLFGTILSVVGILLMAVSGWLGASLGYVRHVGVQTAGPTIDQERRAA